MEEPIACWARFKSNEVVARNDNMKKDLMDIICCPICKGDLTLSVKEEDDKEIVKGLLTCGKCSVGYPIEEGIPNLLPQNTK